MGAQQLDVFMVRNGPAVFQAGGNEMKNDVLAPEYIHNRMAQNLAFGKSGEKLGCRIEEGDPAQMVDSDDALFNILQNPPVKALLF
jgi:hypothetical protein